MSEKRESVTMKTIKILGTGCAKCKETEAVVRETLAELSVSANIEKVEEIEKIMEYDVMSTPALVVDGRVMIRGRVPTKEEVKALFV